MVVNTHIKKEYLDIVNMMIESINSDWTEYARPALFVESNGGIRQILFFANNDANIPLLACNMTIIGVEIPVISADIYEHIGEHICLYSTYNGIKIVHARGKIPQDSIYEISLLELEHFGRKSDKLP